MVPHLTSTRLAAILALGTLLLFPRISVAEDLSHMSISDLLEIDITSVSKKPEKLSDVAAAVHVLTAEDLERSGVLALPEALRLVPGVEVARQDNARWAVAVRGFSGIFSNKLLVMIDGRTVYTPDFSGVFWDLQEIPIHTIERIEVILGPGASIWGANAVNGVINVITKRSDDSSGLHLEAGGGTKEKARATASYSGFLSEDTYYRGTISAYHRGESTTVRGEDAGDTLSGVRADFRGDTDISDSDTLSFSAHGLYLDTDLPFTAERVETLEAEGADADDTAHLSTHLQGRWEREHAEERQSAVQVYYDLFHREDGVSERDVHTFDIEAQHRFSPFENHDLVFGAGFRQHFDNTRGTEQLRFFPDDDHYYRANLFFQDKVDLSSDVFVILGTKLEHGSFASFEFQPTLRGFWRANERTQLWAATSKASRVPARADRDADFVFSQSLPGQENSPDVRVVARGNKDFESEDLFAYEIGARRQFAENLSVDVSAFYFLYRNLQSFEGEPEVVLNPEPSILLDVVGANKLKGESHGVELSVDWRPTPNWRLVANLTYIELNFYGSETTDDLSTGSAFFGNLERTDPMQVGVRSLLNLPYNLEFDSHLRWVDNIKATVDLDASTKLDLRLGWGITESVAVDLIARNLGQARRAEWAELTFGFPTVDIEPSLYAQLRIDLP